MFSNPRGYALIINNESFVNDIYKYRSGSTIDANNLDILFEQLGFKVCMEISSKLIAIEILNPQSDVVVALII